ncbi:MAG: RNA methyltransferase, partial [Fusobacteria bacterium]
MRDKIYLGLVHYPVYNRNQETVATSVTNFDIHDISRSCSTYDVKGYHIITPVDAQIELTSRVIGYWKDGLGGKYNKDREEAFTNTYVTESIEKAIEEIEKVEGKKPVVIT